LALLTEVRLAAVSEKAFNLRNAGTDFSIDCRTPRWKFPLRRELPFRGIYGEFLRRISRMAREFHARCVKISRISAARKFPGAVFLGIWRQKPIGTGIAKQTFK